MTRKVSHSFRGDPHQPVVGDAVKEEGEPAEAILESLLLDWTEALECGLTPIDTHKPSSSKDLAEYLAADIFRHIVHIPTAHDDDIRFLGEVILDRFSGLSGHVDDWLPLVSMHNGYELEGKVESLGEFEGFARSTVATDDKSSYPVPRSGVYPTRHRGSRCLLGPGRRTLKSIRKRSQHNREAESSNTHCESNSTRVSRAVTLPIHIECGDNLEASQSFV